MKICKTMFTSLLLLTVSGVMAQKTEVLYLSGTDKDHTVSWEFFCSEGRNSGQWTTINVPRILLRDNADDFLKEMATPQQAPSGVKYMQAGKPIQSLGVFEHWNNDLSMQYSRNLDPKNGKGIEFIYIPLGSAKN